MKRTLSKVVCLLFVLLIVFTGNIGAANAGNHPDKYRKLAGEEKFTEIKDQLVQSKQNLAQYKASETYQEIVNALNEFHRIRDVVKNASHVDDVIEEVADGFENIASTYEKVVKLGGDLIQYRRGELRYLKDMNRETFRTEQELERKIVSLQDQNKLLQAKLSSTLDEIEKNNIEVSFKGNASIINSLRGQMIIWKKFYDAQNRLYEKLNLNGRKIDSLIHVLEVNAKVYKEAATVTRLRKSAKGALDNLSSLGDIQSIIGDLQNSWTEVDDLVSDISNADFVIDID